MKFGFSGLPSQHLPYGCCFLLALPEHSQGTGVEFIPIPAARETPHCQSLCTPTALGARQSLAALSLPSEQQHPSVMHKLPRLFIPSIICQSILAKTPNLKTLKLFIPSPPPFSLEVNKIHYFPSTNVSLSISHRLQTKAQYISFITFSELSPSRVKGKWKHKARRRTRAPTGCHNFS